MQPYVDPTRKTTSKKKWKTTLKKNENRRQPQFVLQLEWQTQHKLEDDLKKNKMEDDLKKNNGRRPKKKNQPKSTQLAVTPL